MSRTCRAHDRDDCTPDNCGPTRVRAALAAAPRQAKPDPDTVRDLAIERARTERKDRK